MAEKEKAGEEERRRGEEERRRGGEEERRRDQQRPETWFETGTSTSQ
jgi:hypothetical protein